MRKITKRTTAIIAASVIAVGGAGAAWAAWLVSGSGSASAAASSAQNLVATETTVTGQLVPGGTGDVKFSVNNPNSFPVLVDGITVGAITSDKDKCAGTNVVPVTAAPLPTETGALNVGAKTSKTITYKDAIKMIGDAADECQGATFTVAVTLAAKSAAA